MSNQTTRRGFLGVSAGFAALSQRYLPLLKLLVPSWYSKPPVRSDSPPSPT